MTTVSIITVTQHKRQASLLLLLDLIRDQTYPTIIEWILIEGSPTPEEAVLNGLFCTALEASVPLRYIPTGGGGSIGTLRSIANRASSGDIRVVMDDDDYYPPDRVSHAVEALLRSKKQLAGCSNMFLYDYPSQRLVQWTTIHKNHSLSSCMAWTRAYKGDYDPQAYYAEETSFTRGFQEPMVQLDPVKTIVQSSHGDNTWSKTGLLKEGGAFRDRPGLEPYLPDD